MSPIDVISLSVGGKRYQVSKSTLDKYPDTMLSRMVSKEWKHSEIKAEEDEYETSSSEGSVFIDRDGDLFEYILNWYRNGEICIPWSVSEEAIRREASYFALPDDVRVVRDTILVDVRETVNLLLEDVREKIKKCRSDQEQVKAEYEQGLQRLREEKRALKEHHDAAQHRIRRDAMTFDLLLPILAQTAVVTSPTVATTSQQVSPQTVRDIRGSSREDLAELGDLLLESLASYGVPAKSIRLCPTFIVTEYSRCNICAPTAGSTSDSLSRLVPCSRRPVEPWQPHVSPDGFVRWCESCFNRSYPIVVVQLD